jgi:FkbM family methyltransferase
VSKIVIWTDRIRQATAGWPTFALRFRKLRKAMVHPAFWKPISAGVLPTTEHYDVAFTTDIHTVIDVGASRGQFALFAAEKWPRAAITCFEPIQVAASQLRHVLGDRVRLVEAALGEAVTQATLHVACRDDSSSLLPIGRQAAEFRGTDEACTVEVPVRVLREFLSPDAMRPTLLKIDVQGYELSVLKGAQKSLELVDEIFCECSFVELYDGQPLAPEIIQYLSERQFRLAGVYGATRSRTGEMLQADFLFRRSVLGSGAKIG